jgi:hypothetical protein
MRGKRGRLTVGPEVLGGHPLTRGPGREGEGAGGTRLRGPKGRAVEGLFYFIFSMDFNQIQTNSNMYINQKNNLGSA